MRCEIPTRDQLVRKRIFVDDRDKCCVLCFKEDESQHHLFGRCEFNNKIWVAIAKWLELNIFLTLEDLSSFILNF